MGHAEFSYEWIDENERRAERYEAGNMCGPEYLESLGWMKVQEWDWKNAGIEVYPIDKKPPSRQINALLDLCNKYERKFPHEVLER